MAAAAILQIRKIAISPRWKERFDEIWYSDASGTRRYRQQIKIHYFEKQDGGGRHLEKSKNLNIFATD